MMWKRNSWHLYLLTATLVFAAASLLSAQDSLQFNVPYACPDGSTYVVHKCEKGPKFEFCYYQRDQNSERYNVLRLLIKSRLAKLASHHQPPRRAVRNRLLTYRIR